MFKRYILFALCLLPLLGGVSFAADIVSAVRVEGLTHIDVASVQAVISTKVGQEYSLDRVDKDVRAIYALGYFKDIEVDAEKSAGTVILKYILLERTYLIRVG